MGERVMTWAGSFPKPSRAARLLKKHQTRTKRVTSEKKNKAEVRKRDKVCRFPRCGCRKMKLPLESSHHIHKAMGGDSTGERSSPDLMVLLCSHRHRDGNISRHHGTLRPVFLTADAFKGPIAWEVDWANLHTGTVNEPDWREVARERSVGVWDPFTEWQIEVLDELAGMAL